MHPVYGAALEAKAPPKRSMCDRVAKVKRVAKLCTMRSTAITCQKLMQSSVLVVDSIVKFV